MDKKVSKANTPLKGEVSIPADKSISHRAVIFSTLAKGKSVIKNFSSGKDPHSSLEICKALGANIQVNGTDITVESSGKLQPSKAALDCGNSGTTMRLMSGVLAGQNFTSTLIGDESLSKRPMKRIIEPLSLMGAKIDSDNNKAPLKIEGTELNGITYNSPIASAQVKSAILLAGLFANGTTTVIEPYLSRNHTELMLEYMGANILYDGVKTTIQKSELEPKVIEIAGDMSSAAYFIAAALIVPNSDIILKNVGLNPTRTGIIDVLKQMGANIEILDERIISGENVGDLRIKYSKLKACKISGDLIPRLIDEIPILAVVATQAEGTTVIKDAQDLRNKESDRIKAIVSELKNLGANIEETPDGMIINGRTTLRGGIEVESYKDHRLAMSLFVAGLVCENEILIKNFDWVNISFPEFEALFANLL